MKEKNIFLILASQSPRRKQALKKMRYRFRTIHPDIGAEKRLKGIRGVSPSRYVILVARTKAYSVAKKLKKGCVVAADTIIYDKGQIIGKPGNRSEAFRMLIRLSEKKHHVYTGLVVLDVENGRMKEGFEKSEVWIKHLSRGEIKEYFERVNPLDKAGAYAIQEHGDRIVEKFKGSFDNIVGFPLKLFKKLLRQMKY